MSIRIHRSQLLALSITTALAALSATNVLAQDVRPAESTADATAQTTADSTKATTLSEITVRAQKRVELLQDVPITLTTLPEQILRDTGVQNIKDLQILVPALSVTSTTAEGVTTAHIRGVGTVGDNPGLESSVGVVIDGVPRARGGVAFNDLGEIAQIEVLKGPQGTVFGKNTSAGLINITTKRPSFDEEGYANLTLGNYHAAGVDVSYNNHIGDFTAFRIYAVDRKHDGYNKVNTGVGPRTLTTDGDQNFHSVRAQLLVRPSDTFDVNITGDYTRREENCCVGVTLFRGPTAAIVNALSGGNGVIPVADKSRRLAYSNRDTRQNITDKGLAAEANWITPWFDGATLTSITSIRKWTTSNPADLDFSGADLWYRAYGNNENAVRFRTLTQELRLAGNTDRFDWMGGVYFDNEHLQRNDAVSLGAAYEPYLSIALLNNIAASFPPGLVNTSGAATFLSQAAGLPFGTAFVGPATHDRWNQVAKSTAAFGNVTFHATDALALTAGGRYTHAKKTVDSVYTNPNGSKGCTAALTNPTNVALALIQRGIPPQFAGSVVPTVIGFMCLPWANPQFAGMNTHQNHTENEWSGTLKAAYRWNDRVMGYASAARGYKAGGFNLDRVQSANGLNNGSVGITPVSDTWFPGEFVNSYELGTKTTWADGNLLLNAALFQSDYSDFQLNSFLGTSFVVQTIPKLKTHGLDADLLWQTTLPGLSVQGGLTYLQSEYGNDPLPEIELRRLPGATASFTPKWSFTGGFTYEWNFNSSLTGRFNVGAKHTTSYNTGSDLNPLKIQSAYTLVNARFVVGAVNKHWQVELWANNLTNETYTQVAYDAPLQTGSINGFLGAPRTFGITLRGQL